MATIKSYTDIEQSKKLAEILPLESADMYYILMPDGAYNQFPLTGRKTALAEDTDIPCWSLAALLNVLPDEIEYNHFLTLQKEKNEYLCCYEDINGNSFRHSSAIYDNPVDACVAIIEKLNELKML